jgi:hypothetical protein
MILLLSAGAREAWAEHGLVRRGRKRPRSISDCSSSGSSSHPNPGRRTSARTPLRRRTPSPRKSSRRRSPYATPARRRLRHQKESLPLLFIQAEEERDEEETASHS